MESTLKDLKERRSIRAYRPEQIKEEELQKILEAGTYAPTGMGMQSPKIIVVQDQETRDYLSKLNASVLRSAHCPCGAGFKGAPHLCGGRLFSYGESDERCPCSGSGFLLDPQGERGIRL